MRFPGEIEKQPTYIQYIFLTIAATSTTPWDGVADHGLNGHISGGGADGAVVHAVALGCDVGTATAVRALELDVGYEKVWHS